LTRRRDPLSWRASPSPDATSTGRLTLERLDDLLSGNAGEVAQVQLDARAGIPHKAAPRIGEAACAAGPDAFRAKPC